jgi:hypothetical protein
MEEADASCGICQEAYEEAGSRGGKKVLPCNHSFHADCLVGWFLQGTVSCPYCRQRFGNDASDLDVSDDPPDSVAERDAAPSPVEGTESDPYWTNVARPGYGRISSREVVKWVFSKMRTLSRRKAAPVALKRRLEVKKRIEAAVADAKRALKELSSVNSSVKGTWKDLHKKRSRLFSACCRATQADVESMYSTVKFCQDDPKVRKFLLETRPAIPRPPWWR